MPIRSWGVNLFNTQFADPLTLVGVYHGRSRGPRISYHDPLIAWWFGVRWYAKPPRIQTTNASSVDRTYSIWQNVEPNGPCYIDLRQRIFSEYGFQGLYKSNDAHLHCQQAWATWKSQSLPCHSQIRVPDMFHLFNIFVWRGSQNVVTVSLKVMATESEFKKHHQNISEYIRYQNSMSSHKFVLGETTNSFAGTTFDAEFLATGLPCPKSWANSLLEKCVAGSIIPPLVVYYRISYSVNK